MKTGERVSYSPGEFAALFGKSQTWGYRQIYAGKVKAITEYGRLLIPAAEVEKILGSAQRYEGVKKPSGSKAKPMPSTAQLQSAWRAFIGQRRSGKESAQKSGFVPRVGGRQDCGHKWRARTPPGLP